MPRTLSQRETGILRCLMQGEPNKIIARQFDITDATVKVHIKAILQKICVRNRTQAAVWAHNHLTKTVHGPIADGVSVLAARKRKRIPDIPLGHNQTLDCA
jgi:two-component system, NarL family, nitrate/nitrite response regulator NarL